MTERIAPPVQTPDYTAVSDARLRITETSQIARVIVTDVQATFARAAVFASSVLRRMHGERLPIEWDADLEESDPELAAQEHEEHEKLRAIHREINRRRCLRQAAH